MGASVFDLAGIDNDVVTAHLRVADVLVDMWLVGYERNRVSRGQVMGFVAYAHTQLPVQHDDDFTGACGVRLGKMPGVRGQIQLVGFSPG